MREDLRALLDEQPWEEHIERLTVYARSLLKQRYWRGVLGGHVPGGMEAADFALETIQDIYAGKRQWDPEQCPDLSYYLRGVVRSKISNIRFSAENKSEERESPATEMGREDDHESYILGFLTEIENEPLLVKVLECVLDGCTKRAEIAEKLGVQPGEITNIRKKLQRRLTDYQTQLRQV